jgi:predicted nucleic acid-binding protein
VIVVSDTSPITALITIQQIDLLRQLYNEVKIPSAVAEELLAYHTKIPSFIQAVPVTKIPLLAELNRQLDRGEAEAIVLAKELHADLLLIDEAMGREAARQEHLPVIGLMGVLLIAKKKGLVRSLTEIIDRLETEAGFYLSRPQSADSCRRRRITSTAR